MKRNSFFLLILFALFSLLMGGCSENSDFSSPSQKSSLQVPSFLGAVIDPNLLGLNLSGKVEVMKEEKGEFHLIQEITLELKWTPRDPDREESPKILQLFPKEGLKISGLKKGTYLFKVSLSHQNETWGEIEIAELESEASIASGEEIDVNFSQSIWKYDLDDDVDGVTNVAELTYGYFRKNSQGKVSGQPSDWVPTPKNPRDANSYPPKGVVFSSALIGSTSPNGEGKSKVIGDPHAVQSGTQYVLIHYGADGKIKEKIEFWSRIDGSFEVETSGSQEKDRIGIFDQKLTEGGAIPDLNTSVSQGVGTELTVRFRPVKMLRCGGVYKDGSITLEGEGLSSIPEEQIIYLPKLGGGNFEVKSGIRILGQNSRTTELEITLPTGVESGYPLLRVFSGGKESYGECPIHQPIIIPQGGNLSDLLIVGFEVPSVILVGQLIEPEIDLINQGALPVLFPFAISSYLSTDSPSGSSAPDRIDDGKDIHIFPGTIDWSHPREGEDLERLTVGLKENSLLTPTQFSFLVSPQVTKKESTLPLIGPKLWKIWVDPNRGGTSFLFEGEINELNEKNNVKSSRQSSWFHSLELDFLSSGDSVTWNNEKITLQSPESGKLHSFTSTKKSILLKKGENILLDAGKVFNRGTFPMIRQCDDPQKREQCDYLPKEDPRDEKQLNDPLNTLGDAYQAGITALARLDEANGKQDLEDPLFSKMLEEADWLNQHHELPVLIRTYYSSDDKLITNPGLVSSNQQIDFPIVCGLSGKNCEICVNRLERGDSTEPIHLSIPHTADGLLLGNGSLFLVAEAMQIDPTKVEKNGKDFDYCSLNEEGRKNLNLPTRAGNESNPIWEPILWNNTIRIPIEVKAPDLVFEGAPVFPNPLVIEANLQVVQPKVLNNGTADTTPTTIKVFLKNAGDVSSTTGKEIGKTSVPALAPGASYNPIIPVTIPNDTDIPFGKGQKLSLILDQEDQVLERGRDRSGGENNNQQEALVDVTAPDLTFYGVGISSCSGGKCQSPSTPFDGKFNASSGDTIQLDIYVRNIGTASAKGDYKVKVSGSTGSCSFETISDKTSPLLKVGEWARVPISLTLPNDPSCKSSGNGGTPNGINLRLEIIGAVERAGEGENGIRIARENSILDFNNPNFKYFQIKPGVTVPNSNQSTSGDLLGQYFETGTSTIPLKVSVGFPELSVIDQTLTVDQCFNTNKDCVAGYEVNGTIQIKNLGDGEARKVKTKIKLYKKDLLSGDYTEVRDLVEMQGGEIDSVPLSGGIFPVKFTLPVSEYSKSGIDYKMTVVLDPENTVGEVDKNSPVFSGYQEPLNNESKQTSAIEITYVDYEASFSTPTDKYKTGETIPITVSVHNKGTHSSIGAITTDLYVKDINGNTSSYLSKEPFKVVLEQEKMSAGETRSKAFNYQAQSGFRPTEVYVQVSPGIVQSGSNSPWQKSIRVDDTPKLGETVEIKPTGPYKLGDTLTFKALCTDPENDPLKFSWSSSSDTPVKLKCTEDLSQEIGNEIKCKLTLDSTTTRPGPNDVGVMRLKVSCDDIEDTISSLLNDKTFISIRF